MPTYKVVHSVGCVVTIEAKSEEEAEDYVLHYLSTPQDESNNPPFKLENASIQPHQCSIEEIDVTIRENLDISEEKE